MTRLRRVRLAALGALLGSAACLPFAGGTARDWWLPIAFGAVVAVTELAAVHVSFARQRWTFTMTEGVVGGALLLHGGAWIVPSVLIGVAISQAVRRQPVVKVQYNVAQITASAALAAVVAHQGGGGLVAVVGAMVVYWAANQVLSAVPLSVMTGGSLLRLATESLSLHAIHASASISLGLLGAWLGANEPVGLLGLVAPLSLLWLSYDEQTARTAEARLFEELARGHEEIGVPSTDVSAQVVLTAAARLFGGADVEMVLVASDGPVVYAGDEHGVRRRRAEPTAFDSPWVLRALGARGVATGVDDGRPYASAVLGPVESPLAVLVACRPAGAPPFGRREVMLAEVLAQQAESWLSVAELTRSRDQAVARADAAETAARSLGDLGAQSAPALMALQESADRLARLAASPGGPDPLGDIVGELHSVERAVASLLGAIALAAEPGLAVDSVSLDPPAVDPAHEWTTTGTLSDHPLGHPR